MEEKEVVSILRENGWVCGKDEVGDYFCVSEVGDVQVQVIPSVGRRSDHFRVSLMPSLSTKAFSDAVSYIRGQERGNTPILVSRDAPEKLASFSSEDVIRLSEQARSWARSQDVDAGLKAYRGLPTDAKGQMPIRHLAALAVSGDAERLAGYKKSFEQGERLGFVPYITFDMIERAFSLAQEKSTHA